MTYESLSDGGFATGSVGSGGFIVYDDTSCIVNTGIFSVSITISCGQCSPCREGQDG
jgi:NADH-quinone oxidoreductase subunit F